MRHAYATLTVSVPLALADDAIAAALFRVTPGDEAEMVDPSFELAALDALREWGRVVGAELHPPFRIIETDREGVPLAIG